MTRMEGMTTRLQGAEERLRGVENRLNGVEETMEEIRNMVLDLKKQVVLNEKNHEEGPSHTVGEGEEKEGDNRSRGSRDDWRGRDKPVRRVNAPVFSGTDPEDWLARIEEFFDLGRTAEQDRLSAVAGCFEGQALKWMQYRERTGPFTRWSEFRRALERRFWSRKKKMPEEEMKTLRQTSSVKEYRGQCEELPQTRQTCEQQEGKRARSKIKMP